jgi:hypothetical protein
MLKRIRDGVALIAAALMLIACTQLDDSASATSDPSSAVPHGLTKQEAYHLADLAAHQFFANAFPKPHHAKVAGCGSGPTIWKCPMTLDAPDTHCSAVYWVWVDRRGSEYYEWHHLRCTGRS